MSLQLTSKKRSNTDHQHSQNARQHEKAVLEVVQKFRIIFKSIKSHFQWVQQKTGISGAQLWLLSQVGESQGVKVSELAHSLAIHQSTVSNLIDRLEKNDFIRRERQRSDQRVVKLYVTKKGAKIISIAPRPLRGALPEALDSFSQRDLYILNQQLSNLIKGMKVRDMSGKHVPLSEM